ncbi:hypothetical protein J6590_078190 [Homalodisca vitripennis]|nr:hypothetical protein J6590_078190 [Homalodisca vitripennis]
MLATTGNAGVSYKILSLGEAREFDESAGGGWRPAKQRVPGGWTSHPLVMGTQLEAPHLLEHQVNPPGPDRSVHQYKTRTRDKFRSTHHRTVLFSTEISQTGINQSEVNPPGPDRSGHQYKTRTRDKFRSTHHRTVLFSTEISQAGINQSEVNPPGPDRSVHQYETRKRDKFRSTHHRTVLFSTEISQAGINQSEENPPPSLLAPLIDNEAYSSHHRQVKPGCIIIQYKLALSSQTRTGL